jgi:hypothetical protein
MGWMVFILILLGVFAVFAYANPLGNGGRYRPGHDQFAELESLNLTVDPRGSRVIGNAHAEKRGGLHILWLEGSAYEMGFQHGRLLREEIRNGAMPYHAYPVYNLPPFNQFSGWKKWLLVRYFDWTVFRSLRQHAPTRFLEEIKGLADGSGLNFDLVLRGNLLSEFNMVTAKIMKRFWLRRLVPGNECTSFAAYGSKTRDGSLVMGRNTDYSGAGLWDRTQTVFFYKPQEGFCYVNVGSAGLIKCNSCMNDQGLCLGGHFMYSEAVRPEGAGFTALEQEIMLHASDIEQAFDIVQNNRRAGAFAYLMADGNHRQAAVIEATTQHAGLRWAKDDSICETNFMTCAETRDADMLLEIGIAKNPISRFRRMEEMISDYSGSITLQRAAQFMGDHMDMTSGELRPFGNVIATLGNLTSVVFKPEDFTFWVADGLAPVCNNSFVGFDFKKELQGSAYLITPQVLESNDYAQTASFEVLRQYYPIRVAAVLPPFYRDGLVEKVSEIVHKIPGEVAYRLLLAKLLFRGGQIDEAANQFHLLVDYALSPNEQAQVMLFLAYTYDLRGQRENAMRCYTDLLYKTQSPKQDHLTALNPFVLADAKKYLRDPFTSKDRSKIEISMDMNSSYDR